ncbi:uncharacterized protein [Ptychodera flava]|uniref:uncharacterized protein n=1 Tax=Ptychodera flava TaxID=63121 RepID=UPI00396A7661
MMETVRRQLYYLETSVLCLCWLIRLFCIASSKPVGDDGNVNFTVSIPESSKPGEKVFNFQNTFGSDVHSFQILSGNKDERFKITSNGILITNGFLDFDVYAHYRLHISYTVKSWENETTLTVTVLDEISWPPFYNSRCETPVYEGSPIDTGGFQLISILNGDTRQQSRPASALLDLILEVDTDNGRCSADIFVDLFDSYMYFCDYNVVFNQIEGPPIPVPEFTYYKDRSVFPRNFSQDSSVRSNCLLEIQMEDFYVNTSAPIGLLMSDVAPSVDIVVNAVKVELVTQGCPEGRYGFFCDKECICQNGATCHGFNGACKCSNGWTGPACDMALKDIWVIPVDANPIYGEILYISCHYSLKVNFNGTTWAYFNGSSSRVLGSPTEQISYELHSSRLTIAHFNEDRVGTYQCSVTDQDGVQYTANATVTYAGCAENLFGDFCNNTCNCEQAIRCDRSTGCICVDGWAGKLCDFDIQAPNIIDCPGDKTVLAEVDENSAEVSWWNPTIVDNSGQPVVWGSNRKSGERFAIGKHDIIMWASDQSNNTAFCNFSVFVARLEENAGTISIPVYVWAILVSVVVVIVMLLVYIAKRQWLYVPLEANDQEFEYYLKEHLPKAAFAWDVERKALKILEDEPIGVGEYGRVYKARLTIRGKEYIAAAKTLCETRSDAISRKNFVNEVRCLVELVCYPNHPNIISFLGIVTIGDPKYILTEYASNGDLKDYLMSLRLLDTETETMLIKVARDIAKALSFMSTKGVMHKDIAARNVFLTNDFTAKIGDFGLGRDVYERPPGDYQSLLWANHHDRFPLRWMPPEFLKDGTFSVKSDIWSYGILLWEIGSLGGSPMMGVENLLEYLQGGGRPAKPEGCTHPAYRIMRGCWQENRHERPTPDQLNHEFYCMLSEPAHKSERFFTKAFKERYRNPANCQPCV